MLIEKRDFDRNPPPRQRGTKRSRRESGIEWLRTKIEWKIDTGSVHVDRGQRARVIEHDAGIRLEMEDRSRESWHRLGRRTDDPISVHSKMHVKDATVIEMNELVFPSTLDGGHSRTGEGTQRAARQASSQGRMQHACASQRRPFDRRAEESRGAFDFRKLRHELSR